MGRTRRAEHPSLPDAEEKFFAGKTLLTASAVVEMRLISQVGEEAYLENPLDILLEQALVDEI